MRPENIRCSRWIIPSSSASLRRGPSAVAGRTEFHLLAVKYPACPMATLRITLSRSYSITAEVEIPKGGAEGMLNTLGGRFGGYGLYLLKGKPVFTYNLLASGKFPLGRPAGAHARQTHHLV